MQSSAVARMGETETSTPERPAPPPLGADQQWIVHLYRALAQEVGMWRQRLDVTANWAIPLLIALITLALSEPAVPHFVVLVLGWSLILLTVLVEARRYRVLHHTLWRVRLIERGYFARLLESREPGDSRWQARLSADLRRPVASIGMWTAVALRLRTTYLPALYLLLFAWLLKLAIHPMLVHAPGELYARMAIDQIPSWFVAAVAVVVMVGATILASLSPHTEELESPAPRSSPRASAGARGREVESS